MSTPGIDISVYQTITPNLTGLSFVFCRATYGTSKDTRYDQHSANVLAAGKVLGAYHFGRRAVDHSIASQVAAFLAVAGNAQLLALDLEADAGTLMSNTDAAAFIKALKAADPKGRKVLLYHSASGFPTGLGQDFNWPACWGCGSPGVSPWTIWQNSDKYNGSGANGDADIFNGTEAQLLAFVGSGSTGGGTTTGGGDVAKYIAENGLTGYGVSLPQGTQFYYLDGSAAPVTLSAAGVVPVFGLVDAHSGQYEVLLTTGNVTGKSEKVRLMTKGVTTLPILLSTTTPGGDVTHQVRSLLEVDGKVVATAGPQTV